MEATKKTSTTKAALLVVAALSMLLSGLFIATASRSDASPPPACPDGFTLTADGKNCFQKAVVTSADNPNSCVEGLITPDGTKCYIAARLIPQEGKTECPKGYSPDDSLGGMCARFEAASQRPEGCPEGARGVAGGCYILVAKGPRGTLICEGDGAVAGDICVTEGRPPVRAAGTCPTGADIILPGCYRVVSTTALTDNCVAPYVAYGAPANTCRVVNPFMGNGSTIAQITGWECPSAGTNTPTENVVPFGDTTKVASCEYARTTSGGDCPTNTQRVPETGSPFECRVAVPLIPGALVCPDAGFGVVSGKCIAQSDGVLPAAQCPAGSFEDSTGQCRKPVANAKGAYYCKGADGVEGTADDAAAALNGKSCVYTAPFTVTAAPNAYKCDKGVRSVIGAGAEMQVLCFLGDADKNVTEGPSCLQGVLSTDGLYCIVPRIDTAPAVSAPVPAFTG